MEFELEEEENRAKSLCMYCIVCMWPAEEREKYTKLVETNHGTNLHSNERHLPLLAQLEGAFQYAVEILA